MDTKELLNANFEAIEKRYKKGKVKELTPEEKQLCADKSQAREIVKGCCANCANVTTKLIYGKEDGMCGECYAIYNPNLKRFWLARYKKNT